MGPWKLRRGTVGYQLLPTMPRIIQETGDQGRSFTTAPFFADLEVELYNLELDPSERFNVAADHPQLVEDLLKRMEEFAAGLEPGPALLGWPIPGLRIPAQLPEPP